METRAIYIGPTVEKPTFLNYGMTGSVNDNNGTSHWVAFTPDGSNTWYAVQREYLFVERH